MSLRKYLVLLAVIFFQACGDVLLARGMRDVGEIHASNLIHVVTAIANPWVICGIACLLTFFTCYLTSLSWADLSYVLPATAASYVVLALLSKYFLHEQISLLRWGGILLISVGVLFVAGGPSQTQRPEQQQQGEPIAVLAEDGQ